MNQPSSSVHQQYADENVVGGESVAVGANTDVRGSGSSCLVARPGHNPY